MKIELTNNNIYTIVNMFEYLMENIDEIGLDEKAIKSVLTKMQKAKKTALKNEKRR